MYLFKSDIMGSNGSKVEVMAYFTLFNARPIVAMD